MKPITLLLPDHTDCACRTGVHASSTTIAGNRVNPLHLVIFGVRKDRIVSANWGAGSAIDAFFRVNLRQGTTPKLVWAEVIRLKDEAQISRVHIRVHKYHRSGIAVVGIQMRKGSAYAGFSGAPLAAQDN